MKKINNVSIGADPELFLYSEEKQKFVPVCGLVGGTKEEPLAITEDGKFGLQEDNVMLEFTIAPAKTAEEFIKNINFMKEYITETVLKPKSLVPRYKASAHFLWEDLQTEQAQLFGCSPSQSAWTLDQNEVKSDDKLLRSAGFHIHVGYDNPDYAYSIELMKAMDIFLGVPSIIIDTDMFRRKLYGKAGEFRFKPYGAEYRVLSSYLLSNEKLLKWVFDSTLRAIDFVNHDGIASLTNAERIVECINTSNVELAKEIVDDFNIALPIEEVEVEEEVTEDTPAVIKTIK